MIDFTKFYCEGDGQVAGLPEGWDEARADFSARLSLASVDPEGEGQDAVYADRAFALENGYHLVAAGGFVGTWPIEPEIISKRRDSRGGVRIGYPDANDPYTCGICGSPIRYIR